MFRIVTTDIERKFFYNNFIFGAYVAIRFTEQTILIRLVGLP